MSHGISTALRPQFLGNPNRRQGGTGKTIAIILGILGILGVLCCGGFSLMAWIGYSKAGLAIIEPLKSYPEVVSNIGEFKSASINLQDTMKVQQAENNQELIVVDVQGSAGKGQFIIIADKSGSKDMKMARLRLPDGKDIELVNTVPDFEAPVVPFPSGSNN